MSKGSFLKGLFAGVLAGASFGVLAGLFSAPKSGKELREDLRKYVDHLSVEVQKRAKELREMSEEAYEKIVDEAMEAYEKLKSFDQDDLVAIRTALLKEWEKFSKTSARTVRRLTR
ncbi:MAG: YtxH domain-containing protein [Candidatus Dojkabacteria bacterium]|nr:MAG: YtxH domain-containing protein [Candidatus Dojkabacteria bacterium]